jgi:glycosyltransferase involved in cell wall biosynthesis
MNQRPLVSCVITFFNTEKFLEEAISSVIAQDYKHWELLLVDDGSTDRSTEIAQQYAHIYPEKIQYLEHEHHQNKGVCAARNLGFRQAQGTYLAFLDADDVWLPHKLEQQVNILESHPEVGMVYGRTQYWYSWAEANTTHSDYIPDLGVALNTVIPPPALLPLYLKGDVVSPCPSDVLLRHELVRKLGGFEEQFRGIYQNCEDQAFFAKVSLCSPIIASDQCWDKYRQHAGSCSAASTNPERAYRVWEFYLEWLENYLLSQSCHSEEVWSALNQELVSYRHPVHRFLHSNRAKLSSFLNS